MKCYFCGDETNSLNHKYCQSCFQRLGDIIDFSRATGTELLVDDDGDYYIGARFCKTCNILLTNPRYETCFTCWQKHQEDKKEIIFSKYEAKYEPVRCKACGEVISNPKHLYCKECWKDINLK